MRDLGLEAPQGDIYDIVLCLVRRERKRRTKCTRDLWTTNTGMVSQAVRSKCDESGMQRHVKHAKARREPAIE